VETAFDAPDSSSAVDTSTTTPQSLPRQPVFESTSISRTKQAPPLEPVLTYKPHHPLLGEVRIYPWRSSFNFYERFCHIADALFARHGTPCHAVPFFSYMPQYDQMSRAQLDWYLYWRDCVRNGEYPDTDYSYIFLYLF
jgi:hypothetical protein